MKLIIHRGAAEIGGSCIEIASDTTRIILDVGTPLEDGPQELRQPQVTGLFEGAKLFEAILLSHAHLDHSGLLTETIPEVPIYLTSGTSKMLMASAIYGRGQRLPRGREKMVRPGERIKIGNLTVVFHSVDHSVYGSTAMTIEGDGKRILYSGDLRMHGRKPGMAKLLISYTKHNPIDVLLMEGTNLAAANKSTISEIELEAALLKMFRQYASLVIGFFSPQNIDRLVSFYKATRKSGRIFVADRYTASIMYLLHNEVKLPMPLPEAGIRVYFNRVGRKCAKLEKHFRSAEITWAAIQQDPERYVMISRPPILEKEFRWNLPIATLGVFSMWAGYLDQPEWVNVAQRIQALPGDFVHCHASGHIHTADLRSLVKAIAPRAVVPVHTRAGNKFRELFSTAKVLANNEVLKL